MKRFWDKVHIRGDDECWEWSAGKSINGYGSFRYKGVTHNAHRLCWELLYGEIAEGLCVCHTCDNRACVNPSHLFLATQRANMQDMRNKSRHNHGEDHSHARLNAWKVRVIKRLLEMGQFYQREIGELFDVSQMSIGDINTGRTWSAVTGYGHRDGWSASGRDENTLRRIPRPKHWGGRQVSSDRYSKGVPTLTNSGSSDRP